MSEFTRYARQIQASSLGEQGQRRLQNASVSLVGVGGLGGLVALQLVGAGLGRLRLMDDDRVAISNLHRQWLFSEDDIGHEKAVVACHKLRKLNSEVDIEHHVARLNTTNVTDFIDGADIVIDAADNFICSYLLSKACKQCEIPLLTASVNQRYGYISLLCIDPAPGFHEVYPSPPSNTTSCDTVGVSGPAVGVIASLQAQAAIDYIQANGANSLLGKLLYVDLNNYSMYTTDVSVASTSTQTASLAPIALISASEILTTDTITDVRTPVEVSQEAQPFKVDLTLPLDRIKELNEQLPENHQRVVFACKSGQRALLAAQEAWQLGIQQLAVIVP